jgi:hypothetical protein
MSALLTLADAAAYLGLSMRSMRMIGPDRLPKYKVGPRGGKVMYLREDVEAYLASCKQPVPPKIVRRMVGRPDGKPFRHI